jgi:hypothetical protein
MNIPRLVPEKAFPPYSFVPGRFPHPISDPAGHSFRAEPGHPTPLDPQRWEASEAYLYGIDLFNGQFYWEAHESWEGLWHAAGRKGTTADFLKGLIKLAAAGVKHRQGAARGVKSHACRAAELLRAVARSPEAERDLFLGFHVADPIALADSVCRMGWPEQPPLLLPRGRSRTGEQ